MPVWKGDLPGINEWPPVGGSSRTGCFFPIVLLIAGVVAVFFFFNWKNQGVEPGTISKNVAGHISGIEKKPDNKSNADTKKVASETAKSSMTSKQPEGKVSQNLFQSTSNPEEFIKKEGKARPADPISSPQIDQQIENSQHTGGASPANQTLPPGTKKEESTAKSVEQSSRPQIDQQVENSQNTVIAPPVKKTVPPDTFRIQKSVVSANYSNPFDTLRSSPVIFTEGIGLLYYIFNYTGYIEGEVVHLQLVTEKRSLFRKTYKLKKEKKLAAIALTDSFVPGRYTVILYDRNGIRDTYVFSVQAKKAATVVLPEKKELSNIKPQQNTARSQGYGNPVSENKAIQNYSQRYDKKFCYIYSRYGRIFRVVYVVLPAKKVAEHVLYRGHLEGEPFLGEFWKDERNMLHVQAISEHRARELLNGQ